MLAYSRTVGHLRDSRSLASRSVLVEECCREDAAMGNPRANNDNKVSRLSAGGRTSTEAKKGSRIPSSLNVLNSKALNIFWDAVTAGGFGRSGENEFPDAIPPLWSIVKASQGLPVDELEFLIYILRKNAMHETSGIDFALHKGPRTFLLRDILPNIRRYLVPLLALRINYHVTGHKFHHLRDSSTSMFISDFRRLETRYRFRPSPAAITATDASKMNLKIKGSRGVHATPMDLSLFAYFMDFGLLFNDDF
ncbi:hypothetical protein EV421DRAFT_1735387 [Armillaria borealis]|uniref:Uncharacterized protein n=1 Tax=Armillaria borealis TaxID=47425 RepID=A0AA39JLV2_9AGAR|nr:hypothetical protein EV421DRAFT_1735387 [Armillaria borealis]